MNETFYILSAPDEILCAENGDRLIWAVVPAVPLGGVVRPVALRVTLRGALTAPAPQIAGTLDVRVAARGAWRSPRAVPVVALDCRVTLAGQWTPRPGSTQARAVVANPGQHVVVIESDDEDLVLVQ